MNALSSETQLAAFGVIAVVFALFAVIELVAPVRSASRGTRWITNITLFVIDTLAVRLLIPLLMIGTAALAAERGWGLLNLFPVPDWAGIVFAVVALDLALYIQHWATHRVPLLWRLHKVHHVDPAFDVTTAARFHPIEIGLSMLYKMVVVVVLGLSVWGVFLFELMFTIATLFTHANFALPRGLEKPVRALLVTPDMHRIHHSAIESETNSNYGTLLSGWDRLFGTHTAKASEGQNGLTIGLEGYQDRRPHGLSWSLLFPFRD